MNQFVVLLLVVLVMLTVIAVIAQVYCSMAETRRSKGKVTPVKKNQTIKVQEPSSVNGSVGAARKIA